MFTQQGKSRANENSGLAQASGREPYCLSTILGVSAVAQNWGSIQSWIPVIRSLTTGTSLAIQWLRLCTSTGGMGSIPGQGTKILHILQGSQKIVKIIIFLSLTLFFTKVQLLYSVMLVSAIQQHYSAICIHISPLFYISFAFRSPQSTEQSSLCCVCVCVCACMRVCTCSVISDFLQSHGWQPSRLLCPWNFPGKNTGAGCHFLLRKIFLTQGPNLSLCASCIGRQILQQLCHLCYTAVCWFGCLFFKKEV